MKQTETIYELITERPKEDL